jgi:hypothetical protein
MLSSLLLLAACGGGGGGDAAPPATQPMRLTATALDLGPATSSAELVVSLPDTPTGSPVLLQVAIELPPALVLAAGAPLQAATNLVHLEGEWHDGRYLVLCGDAQNRIAAPLPTGALFRLRLAAATPRQVGQHEIRLLDLRATDSVGTRLPVATDPLLIPVTVR